MQLPAPFGKYELLERIATGGMAEVYLARSFGVAGFEKRLCIKRLRPELADDPRFVQMFIAEAKIGVHLNHPNVVQVYELGRVGNAHYIAMEHLHGRDLTRVVRALRARDDRLPLGVAVAIVAEVCRGLAYAHGRTDVDGRPLGLVHRDVSPHNILVTFAGEVKLVDFGIARLITTVAAAEAPDRKPGPGGGKYAYMSPEQASGGAIDHRSDLFSTGIVLWELIAGRRLFQDPDHAEKLRRVQEAVIPHPSDGGGTPIDDGLWAILQKALARNPDERYPNAALFEEDLRAWLFEQRHRVGRPEIARLLREAFPDEADRAPDDLQLQQLVADVGRLDPENRSDSDPCVERSHTPLPGRLPQPVGERRPVVVVMVDVDGLTELSNRVEPETLMKRKYQLLRWVRKIVDRYGGLVQHAVDDHITLLFGVPRTRTDDAQRALECALALQRNVHQLRRNGMALELAIGVHTGEVTVSPTARRARVRYVARGDTTRFARRLSAEADHGQVLVSARVLASVEGWFRIRSGPGIPCRGGKPDQASYLVEGRARGLRTGPTGPWLRRGDELDVLRNALVALGGGRGSTVLLVGDIGCGKSRFLREIRELAGRRGLSFLGVRCTAIGSERPLEPVRDLVAAVLGADPEAPPETLAAASDRLQQVGVGARDLAVVSGLLKGTDEAQDAAEVFQAVGRILRGLAADRPLIVAFDDAHATSPAERAGLANLASGLGDTPVLLLLGLRPPLPKELEGIGTVVPLGAFGTELVARLVETRMGVSTVDPELLSLLERTCEGNPLYLEEMLKFLADSGKVAVEGDRAVLLKGFGPELPHSLQALITARIDTLDAASRGLLQLAAVAGPTFTVPVLAEAAGVPDPMPMLLDLLSHGLVVRDPGPGDEWAFASDLVREAALRGTLGVQRRDYHRLLAAAIEAVYAGRLEPHVEALMAHCAEGGRLVDAARYAYQAGQQHERAQQLERARRCYLFGLEQIAKADRNPDSWDARVQGEATLNLRLGVVELLLGATGEAHRRLHVALDVAAECGLPWIEARAHVALGRSFLSEGRTSLATAHLSQARAVLRASPDPEVDREAVEAMAMLAYEQGRNDDAERLWQHAMALAAGDPAAMARCGLGLASRFLRSGDHGRAQTLLEHALESARAAGDRILEGRVLNNLGLVHSWAGRYADALRFYRSALELREGIGYTRGIVVNHHNIGDVHFHSGEYAKAWVSFERSRDLAAEIGWEKGVALNEVFLAYLEAADGKAGVEAILEAARRARALGDGETVATGLWLAGRWLAENGRTEEARGQLVEALAEARRVGLVPMAAAVELALARLPDPEDRPSPGV